MDTKKSRVGLYCRVSSQEQAQEGVSIEAQIADLKAYAISRGWETFDIYVDRGYSGGTDDRPEFKRLLNDANRHCFDIIAVCKLDRFFRNLRLLLNYLHDLEQLQIKFVSTQEGLDTSTPYGKFAVQIMGVIAEFEKDRIGERVRDSRRYQLSQGHWPGGRTVYGYRWLPKEKSWEVDEKEAETVRYIYHLYLDENMGMMKIILRLNQEEKRTRSGYLWRYHSIHRILSHPAYKGLHDKGLTMPVSIRKDGKLPRISVWECEVSTVTRRTGCCKAFVSAASAAMFLTADRLTRINSGATFAVATTRIRTLTAAPGARCAVLRQRSSRRQYGDS